MRRATVILSSSQRVLPLLICLLCMILARPLAAFAQASAPTPLPPAAQEALNKGIIAAKVPDYLLAIRYFEEARKLSPSNSPVIFLNMGIAESKMTGRELRAIAWFGAYLAASPAAPNAGTVKDEIQVLLIRSQSSLSKLIAAVETAADNLPEGFNPMTGYGRNKDFVLGEVPGLWAVYGDFERAQNCATRLKIDSARDGAYSQLALAQASKGEQSSARRSTDRIKSESDKNVVLGRIAEITKSRPWEKTEDTVGFSRFLDLLYTNSWVPTKKLDAAIFLDINGFLKDLPPPSKDAFDHYHALAAGARLMLSYHDEVAMLLSRLPK